VRKLLDIAGRQSAFCSPEAKAVDFKLLLIDTVAVIEAVQCRDFEEAPLPLPPDREGRQGNSPWRSTV